MAGAGKVALITGANSGVGLALVERLWAKCEEHKEVITIVMGCRNLKKAAEARADVMSRYPFAIIELLEIDVSKPDSVLRAAAEFKTKYDRLDYLYLNAGVMNVIGLDWSSVYGNLYNTLCTGGDILKQEIILTDDGLELTFASNVFGHFILIQELTSLLQKASPGKIMWTSSTAAQKSSFKLEDMQCMKGNNQYSSSKWAVDLLNRQLNASLNEKGIYSYVMCPGYCFSGMTSTLLPLFIWPIVLMLFFFMRIFTGFFTVTCFNGSEALLYFADCDVRKTDTSKKYFSEASILNRPYVKTGEYDADAFQARKLYEQLDHLAQGFRDNYKKSTKKQ
eukprot:Nk52_evm47s62 gene=Nk52_evmTU47s62